MAQTLRADEEVSKQGLGATRVLAGRYELAQRLGEGQYGEVWSALDLKNTWRRVAVKILKTDHLTPAARRRFSDECAALELLSPHPNIVSIHERGAVDGQDFMVLELVNGPSLAQWLKTFDAQSLPTLTEVLRLFEQICVGVAAAHGVTVPPGPIVHRDVKPDNIVLMQGPKGELTAKLLDFGVARLGTQRHTVVGQLIGTPLYMAPEQLVGDEQAIGPWSDVFALGVLLIEMLTLSAHGPDGESSVRGVAANQPQGLRAYLRDRRPDVPPALWEILLKALSGQQQDRFPDAAALLAALRTLAAGSSGLAGAPELSHPRLRWRIGLLTVLCALLCVTGAILYSLHLPARWLHSLGRYRTLVAATPSPMLEVPGGVFNMGTSPSGMKKDYEWCIGLLDPHTCKPTTYQRELPQRQVRISTFWLDRTEVSNLQLANWLETLNDVVIQEDHTDCPGEARFVLQGNTPLLDLLPCSQALNSAADAAKKNEPRFPMNGLGYNGRHFIALPGYEEIPAIQVSWYAAQRYCASLGRRLPTEAEWEYAARDGGGEYRFPWGFDDPRCEAVTFLSAASKPCSLRVSRPRQVGSSAQDRTPLGVLDLGGNVSEWVQDAFTPQYTSCSGGPCVDPIAEEPFDRREKGNIERVIRGGSWAMPASACRSAARSRYSEEQTPANVGFRCASSRPPRERSHAAFSDDSH